VRWVSYSAGPIVEGLQSPLLYATKNGHSEIVQLIDVNSWDERLQSPLWYAATNRHLEIVKA
jgi:spore maturation protein CgeB